MYTQLTQTNTLTRARRPLRTIQEERRKHQHNRKSLLNFCFNSIHTLTHNVCMMWGWLWRTNRRARIRLIFGQNWTRCALKLNWIILSHAIRWQAKLRKIALLLAISVRRWAFVCCAVKKLSKITKKKEKHLQQGCCARIHGAQFQV